MRTLRQLFILLIILLGFYAVWKSKSFFPLLKNWLQPRQVAVDESPLLVTQIKAIAQLMTVEAYNEVVVDSTRNPLGIPRSILRAVPTNPLSFLGGGQLVLIVRGKILAGVDLQNVNRHNVQHRNDSLFIQLPHAQVFEIITNPSDVETFIEKGTWSEAAATALKLRARRQLLNTALAQGLLPQANAKARQLVYELFKNAGYKHVFVRTGAAAGNRPLQ